MLRIRCCAHSEVGFDILYLRVWETQSESVILVWEVQVPVRRQRIGVVGTYCNGLWVPKVWTGAMLIAQRWGLHCGSSETSLDLKENTLRDPVKDKGFRICSAWILYYGKHKIGLLSVRCHGWVLSLLGLRVCSAWRWCLYFGDWKRGHTVSVWTSRLIVWV